MYCIIRSFFSTWRIDKCLCREHNIIYLDLSRTIYTLYTVTIRCDLSHSVKNKENLKIPSWHLLQRKSSGFSCMKLINWGLHSEVTLVPGNAKCSSNFLNLYWLVFLSYSNSFFKKKSNILGLMRAKTLISICFLWFS